jgi:hypothetical protein
VILIWGFKTYAKLLGIVTLVCGHCQNPAAQRVIQRIRKFTLFWIPLFPVKRQTLMTCTFCGTATALNAEQAAALTSQMATTAAQPPMPAGQAAQPVDGPAELPATDY